ncbi:MAG: phosphoribosyltransferase [Thermoanaerobaculia bacterium]
MSEGRLQILYDEATIASNVRDLGRRLEADHAGSTPVLISIVGGSVVFLADLLRAIEQPVRYEAVQVQYTASAGEDEVMQIHFPISLNVTGQSLVVLKDVVATGVIENYLTTQLTGLGARQVRFVALIDLPEERKSDFHVDYRVFTPRRPGVFVGYGLKRDGMFGNLPYLARLTIEGDA